MCDVYGGKGRGGLGWVHSRKKQASHLDHHLLGFQGFQYWTETLGLSSLSLTAAEDGEITNKI